MAKIGFVTNTTEMVLENQPDVEEPFTRGYLGMSGIAGSCSRKLWLGFRFSSVKSFPIRVKRIFERGDLEEERIIRDLKLAGMSVFKIINGKREVLTGVVGEEQEELVGFAGHAKGHPDGRIIGVIEAPKTEHLLEIKTMNDARWKNFKKNGIEISDPVYYGQMQRYMGKMELTRALIICSNKNDERRGYERIKFDKDYAKILKNKESDIIASEVPHGQKLTRSNMECKRCNHFGVCHDDVAPVKTCRSCEYVDLALEGKWLCSLNDDRELSHDDQLACKPCRGKDYRRLF